MAVIQGSGATSPSFSSLPSPFQPQEAPTCIELQTALPGVPLKVLGQALIRSAWSHVQLGASHVVVHRQGSAAWLAGPTGHAPPKQRAGSGGECWSAWEEGRRTAHTELGAPMARNWGLGRGGHPGFGNQGMLTGF